MGIIMSGAAGLSAAKRRRAGGGSQSTTTGVRASRQNVVAPPNSQYPRSPVRNTTPVNINQSVRENNDFNRPFNIRPILKDISTRLTKLEETEEKNKILMIELDNLKNQLMTLQNEFIRQKATIELCCDDKKVKEDMS